MNAKQKKWRNRIIAALALFVVIYLIAESGWLASQLGDPTALYAEFALFLIPYLIAGYDVLAKAAKGIAHGNAMDESFLMTVATIGAFALVLFPDTEPHMAEGAAVMLFYQVGELFQSYAVGKSRKSIADMMDIAPEFANIMVDGELTQVDPYEVSPGDEIIVKPGERIPLDGVIVQGESQIDTAALTGESVPRLARMDDEVISGCVNLTGALTVRVTKPFEDSTVSRILELVENASEKKARTENFITRFARIYTPAVVGVAVLLAIVPPLLLGGSWSDWIQRGLVFLVVSCPCALVISVPLSFFGGIGGASRIGILVKGSNYLETLAQVETVVFDKTGTLTNGTFAVTAVESKGNLTRDELLSVAAHAEAYSNHPIAASVRDAYAQNLDHTRIQDVEEISGHGIKALIDRSLVLVGNGKLMDAHNIPWEESDFAGTVLHVAKDNVYEGYIVIADELKEDAVAAIEALYNAGVKKTVMLTGDRADVARSVARTLRIDEFRAELLPQDKVAQVERLLAETSGAPAPAASESAAASTPAPASGSPAPATSSPAPASASSAAHRKHAKLAFVGDGINDAPVLTRADVGIAMGAMGSDAAIEAADVVLMDDRPSNIARAIRVARNTMAIVWQNIVFALGVKFAVLILAAFGIANMWMAVFADVGVAVIAILNAMRAMSVKKL